MRYRKIQIAIFTNLILLLVITSAVGLEDKMHFSFEKEQRIWSKWLEENLDRNPPLERLYLLSYETYHREVEERLANYYRDSDFFLIYFERNIDNGDLRTSLFVENSNTWDLIEWTEDNSTGQPLIVETKHEIDDFDKKLARRAVNRRAKNRHFYVGIESYGLMDGTTVYIYVFDENKIGRFAFYGGYGVNPTSPVHREVELTLREVANAGRLTRYIIELSILWEEWMSRILPKTRKP